MVKKGEGFYLKIFKYMKPYIPLILIVVVATFANAIGELALPSLMSAIVDNGIINGDTEYILQTGIRMLVIAFISMSMMMVASYFSSKVAMSFSRDVRKKVFLKVQDFSFEQVEKFGTASLLTRNTDDINQVQRVAMMGLRVFIRAPLMFIGGVFMAYSQNAQLSLILVVAMPLLALSIIIVGRKGFPFFKQIQQKLDHINLIFRERLTGIRIIRAFDREEYEEEKFEKANKDFVDTSIRVNTLLVTLLPVVSVIMNLSTVAVVYFGAKLIDLDYMTVGNLTAYIQYITQILFSLLMFSMIFVIVPSAQASANRINEVLDEPVEDTSGVSKINRDGEVKLEFDDIVFRYPGAENPAIEGLSFTANAGDRISIIGGTGSGKSTILRLLEGFYHADSGSIKYNGTDIRELSTEDLRDEIGYVPQKALLFSGTIADNIKFGKADASVAEMEEALRVAQGYDFVMSLEDGLESPVSQGGTNFSGGQKQRLAIARAIVDKPSMYLFDDSFSALDYATDRKLREALVESTKHAITIIVAQRVSTVVDSDKIIVLEAGKVVGMGTHDELMQSNEIYKDIAYSQGFEEEVIQ